MFCAIATAIDRCKTEGLVDVFQVVKVQRVQKPGLVQDVVSTRIRDFCFALTFENVLLLEGKCNVSYYMMRQHHKFIDSE